MEDLIAEAARRSARYLGGLKEETCCPSGRGSRAPRRIRRPAAGGAACTGGGAGGARRARLARHRGHRRPALLRLRHRRHAAGGAGRQLAGRRLGPERGACRRHAPAGAALEEVAPALAGGPARAAAGGAARRSSPAPPWPTSPPWPPRGTRCSARSGWDVEARRPVRRAADHRGGGRGGPRQPFSRRWGCWASAASAWSVLPVDGQGRMRRRRPAPPCRADDRLRPGRQREHRRLRPGRRRSAPGARAAAPGCTWTAPSGCGRRRARTGPTCAAGLEPRRLLGDRRPQVAERALRQRPRLRARRRSTCRRPWPHAPPTCRRANAREPGHFTPELSRRARGVEVWAALRSLGRSGLADLIERNCRHAPALRGGPARGGLRVLNEVALNQVLVSFGDAERTRRVIAAIQQEGTCWCGGTVWQGRTAMRISVSSWATTGEDVERSLEAIIRVASG